jgi:hypothetical protein
MFLTLAPRGSSSARKVGIARARTSGRGIGQLGGPAPDGGAGGLRFCVAARRNSTSATTVIASRHIPAFWARGERSTSHQRKCMKRGRLEVRRRLCRARPRGRRLGRRLFAERDLLSVLAIDGSLSSGAPEASSGSEDAPLRGVALPTDLPWPGGRRTLAHDEVDDARDVASSLDVPVGHEARLAERRPVLVQGDQEGPSAHPRFAGRDGGDVAVRADGGDPGVGPPGGSKT